MKFRVFIGLMIEAARASETSVENYFTQKYIPEGSEVHTHRSENLKSKLAEDVYISEICHTFQDSSIVPASHVRTAVALVVLMK
jgi:hypothetical protein